jgi:hypothetical protein
MLHPQNVKNSIMAVVKGTKIILKLLEIAKRIVNVQVKIKH